MHAVENLVSMIRYPLWSTLILPRQFWAPGNFELVVLTPSGISEFVLPAIPQSDEIYHRTRRPGFRSAICQKRNDMSTFSSKLTLLVEDTRLIIQ